MEPIIHWMDLSEYIICPSLCFHYMLPVSKILLCIYHFRESKLAIYFCIETSTFLQHFSSSAFLQSMQDLHFSVPLILLHLYLLPNLYPAVNKLLCYCNFFQFF